VGGKRKKTNTSLLNLIVLYFKTKGKGEEKNFYFCFFVRKKKRGGIYAPKYHRGEGEKS